MAKKNPFIEELRELGVTDYQRRKLRELQKEYEESDIYKRIEKANQALLGERIRPVSLNYETTIKLLNYNIYNDINSILKDYKQGITLIEQGTTKDYEDYVNKLADELQEIGVYNATEGNLKDADLKDIEFWYSEYKRYEDIGNAGGMQYSREKIIGILGG